MQNSLTRRRFMLMMAALSTAPLISTCALKQLPISIGLQAWPGYEPIPLARGLGWLDETKVKLVQTSSATESLKLLEQGKIDGAGLTLDEVLRAREKGIALSVILVFDISVGADMLLARPEIKSLAAIKGLRVGVEEGALGALMLHEVLKAAGIKREDVSIVSLTIDQQAEAWRRDNIDAVVTYEPVASQIKAMGAEKLFDSSQIPEVILDVLAVRSSLIDAAHGDALHHLVATHLRALKYLNANPDAASYYLASHFKMPPEQVLASLKGLVLPDLENNTRLLATSSPAILKSSAIISETMQKAGILHHPADSKNLLHPEFLPKEVS